MCLVSLLYCHKDHLLDLVTHIIKLFYMLGYLLIWQLWLKRPGCNIADAKLKYQQSNKLNISNPLSAENEQWCSKRRHLSISAVLSQHKIGESLYVKVSLH